MPRLRTAVSDRTSWSRTAHGPFRVIREQVGAMHSDVRARAVQAACDDRRRPAEVGFVTRSGARRAAGTGAPKKSGSPRTAYGERRRDATSRPPHNARQRRDRGAGSGSTVVERKRSAYRISDNENGNAHRGFRHDRRRRCRALVTGFGAYDDLAWRSAKEES